MRTEARLMPDTITATRLTAAPMTVLLVDDEPAVLVVMRD